jgi:hypothetical protein
MAARRAPGRVLAMTTPGRSAIAPMRGLGLKDGLIAAAKADFISLTVFEVGLFGWMAIMAFVLFPAPHHLMPSSAAYWLLMQVGMIIGYCTLLARKRLASQPRHQGAHVSHRPGCTGTGCLAFNTYRGSALHFAASPVARFGSGN